MSGKIRTVCIDTLTAIQINNYMADKKKPGHDKWKDYGQEIYNFMTQIQELGFEIVLVLGEPGTGKSSGMRTLKADTNIWYNADNKNPVWEGGKAEYGKKATPRSPYHVVPQSYEAIIGHIKAGIDKGMFEEEKYAFVVAHTETYKVGIDTKERLKVLGNMATKMQLEGKMETVFYSRVEMDGGSPKFLLETQNNGYNTARSPMGLFEGKVDNDYNMVIEKLMSY